MNEEANGVKFVRTDIEEGADFTFVMKAPDIVQLYKDQFEIGNVITSLTILEDGTLLMNAVRVGEA